MGEGVVKGLPGKRCHSSSYCHDISCHDLIEEAHLSGRRSVVVLVRVD